MSGAASPPSSRSARWRATVREDLVGILSPSSSSARRATSGLSASRLPRPRLLGLPQELLEALAALLSAGQGGRGTDDLGWGDGRRREGRGGQEHGEQGGAGADVHGQDRRPGMRRRRVQSTSGGSWGHRLWREPGAVLRPIGARITSGPLASWRRAEVPGAIAVGESAAAAALWTRDSAVSHRWTGAGRGVGRPRLA